LKSEEIEIPITLDPPQAWDENFGTPKKVKDIFQMG
jgi:hypothetical protein